MNRIDEKFKELKKNGKKGFIAYVTAGDPNLRTTAELIPALEDSGVDILELGVPFSDPMADGLTNQKSSERALKSGTTVKKILLLVERVRRKSDIPIVLFTYLNPVFRYGWKTFENSGIDGMLILDLPVEESNEEKRILSSEGLKMIYLLAPTSTSKRISLTCKNASGFIYYVSRTGITGVRESVEKGVKPMVEKIKHFTNLPVAVGFGISKPEHVLEVSKYADAIVVGSAIVSRIGEGVRKTSEFVKTLTGVL